MKVTTITRRLTPTDIGESGSHGQPPLPKDTTALQQFQDFFVNYNTYQPFIDVNDGVKQYQISIRDYTSNGKTPSDRLSSINKYAKKYSLEVCDELVLEKVENGKKPMYLLGYLKHTQSIYLRGKEKTHKTATLPNAAKGYSVINDNILKGVISNPSPGEYQFEGKMAGSKKDTVVIKENAGIFTATYGGVKLDFSSKKSYEFDFATSPVTVKEATNSWDFKIDSPILYPTYQSHPYDVDEIDNQITGEDINASTGVYTPGPEDKVPVKKSAGGRSIYPRKKSKSANALKRANHKCEYDCKHPSFLRKNTKITYMEPHHIIPLFMHEEFKKSLDVEANIVSLCSNCHNQIHYGDGKKIIEKLWDLRHTDLDTALIGSKSDGTKITKQELLKIYGY